MVKFTRELEAKLIPEWKDAFVDYRQLKKLIKRIKISAATSLRRSSAQASDADENDEYQRPLRPHVAANAGGTPRGSGFVVLSSLRSFSTRLLPSGSSSPSSTPRTTTQADEESCYEAEQSSIDGEIAVFMEKLEEELEKVDKFFTSMEAQFCERNEALVSQTQILAEVKSVIVNRHHGRSLSRLTSTNSTCSGSAEDSVNGRLQRETAMMVADEVIAVLERHGANLPEPMLVKDDEGRPKLTLHRIDIPATTPVRSISTLGSLIWEDLIKWYRKEGGTPTGGGANGRYVTRKKIQCAEKMIRNAFVELYKGLELLKIYSSLNTTAFIKILKKLDKVAKQPRVSAEFLKKVKSSNFGSSDKIIKLTDEVEAIFIESFSDRDKKKAMKFLKPKQPSNKDSHMVTFFMGLFTGSFVTLFTVYAILAHFCGIFANDKHGYVETIYPVFSMFALLSLHIFVYGCNLFLWKKTRINHNFIFEFSPSTALKHRDAFLICTSLMTTVVGALVIHLLFGTDITLRNANTLPGTLLLLLIGVLICPLDVFYRSTRYCFLRVIRNIIFSPFYKVVMVDFFMADQLTSQIQLLKHMEFTACFFVTGALHINQYETCSSSNLFKRLSYALSFLPYGWRILQCLRRYFEEGRDKGNLYNAGKYSSAVVAAGLRILYATHPTRANLVLLCLSYTIATTYQLYWDFVKDWGLLDRSSSNRWLRNDLILKNKKIYFISLGVNFVLRLAWIAGVVHYNLGTVDHRMVDFLLASAEIMRRGHWNFYRLENEHLNNAGNFRAVKTIPLPFRELYSD